MTLPDGTPFEKLEKSTPRPEPTQKMSFDTLHRPEPECQLPEPVRTEENPYPYPTCPHCGIRYMLMDGRNGIEWVSKTDHAEMLRQMDEQYPAERKKTVREYPGPQSYRNEYPTEYRKEGYPYA